VRKLVAASSASVYGLADEFPTTELHHPYANDTLYGAAKTFNEGLLRSYHGDDWTGLRRSALLNVYGARMGRPWPLHRGPGAMDGTHQPGDSPADIRRRFADRWTSST